MRALSSHPPVLPLDPPALGGDQQRHPEAAPPAYEAADHPAPPAYGYPGLPGGADDPLPPGYGDDPPPAYQAEAAHAALPFSAASLALASPAAMPGVIAHAVPPPDAAPQAVALPGWVQQQPREQAVRPVQPSIIDTPPAVARLNRHLGNCRLQFMAGNAGKSGAYKLQLKRTLQSFVVEICKLPAADRPARLDQINQLLRRTPNAHPNDSRRLATLISRELLDAASSAPASPPELEAQLTVCDQDFAPARYARLGSQQQAAAQQNMRNVILQICKVQDMPARSACLARVGAALATAESSPSRALREVARELREGLLMPAHATDPQDHAVRED